MHQLQACSHCLTLMQIQMQIPIFRFSVSEWFCFFLFVSVTVPEKLDYFISRYAEHLHEKWCIEKVCRIFILILSADLFGLFFTTKM